MGTIVDKINHILKIKENIRLAIINKGISCDKDVKFSEYANKILEISTTNNSYNKLDSILEITSSPENPTMEFALVTPISGKLAVTIDWGDGTTNTEKTHTYSIHGKHEIKIKDCSGFMVNNNLSGAGVGATMLTGVKQLGTTITDCSYMFNNCGKLTSIPETLTIPNGVTDCKYMFSYCSSLTSIPETLTIPSSVTDCSNMFCGCSKLNANINNIINKKFTSSSINILYCFSGCSKLTGDPDKVKQYLWDDTSKIWISTDCFTGCTFNNFNKYIPTEWGGLGEVKPKPEPGVKPGEYSILEVTSSNVVSRMSFYSVTPITGKSVIIDWGDGIVDSSICHTYTDHGPHEVKIENCSAFRVSCYSMPIIVKQLGSTITNCSYMFNQCNGLTSIPKTLTIPQGVISCDGMFSQCTNLTSIPSSLTIPNSVTSCREMFVSCGLTSIPETLTIPDSVIDCSSMFSNCTSLTSIPSTLTIPQCVTNCSYMFGYCSSLTSIPSTLTIPQGVTNCSNMFVYCSSLTSIPSTLTIPQGVTDCSYMFGNCSSLTSIPSTLTIPQGVTDCNSMFRNCTNLTVNINNIINKKFASSSIDISYCFSGCSKLTGDPDKVKPYLWGDTSKTWNSSGCFAGCTFNNFNKYIPTTWGGLGEDKIN